MRTAVTATILATTLLLTPAAALATGQGAADKGAGGAGAKTTDQTVTVPDAARSTTTTPGATTTGTTLSPSAATTTTPASVPNTTITTSAPGGSSSTLVFAPPRPGNLASGHAALAAYANYLQTLVGSELTSQNDDESYVNTIESGCKGSLAPLTQPADQVKPAVQDTLTVLGKEIGDDLAISYDEVAQAPFQRLATQLARLKWYRGGDNAAVISAYVTAETTLLSLPASPLCQDALLAATRPESAPAGTHTFVKLYSQTVMGASSALSGFVALLHAYETTGDGPLIHRIGQLAVQFARDSKSNVLATGQELSTSLETS